MNKQNFGNKSMMNLVNDIKKFNPLPTLKIRLLKKIKIKLINLKNN